MLVLCTAWLGVSARPAAAADSVTFVARTCPSYSVITANLARNNIMQSLKDLGPDSPYLDGGPGAGQTVNPDIEDLPPQSQCAPLVGWQFTLGTDCCTQSSTGPWGSLTILGHPYDTNIVTQSETARLDQNGDPVGDEKIAGATTVDLTDEQDLVAHEGWNQLWVQGGTPDDPILANKFYLGAPGEPAYGFGALRCSNDNLNGDNVEGDNYLPDEQHIFCYEYLVTPPPTAGTITIQKQVVGAPEGDNPSFPFNGSVSFDPNGFQLANGQSMTFARAGGVDWNVSEGAVAGYRLRNISCSAEAAGGGSGTSTSTISGSTATIHLEAEEHETCVFTNRYVPPPGGLTIRKVTLGGVGTFHYTVSRGRRTHRATATTTHPHVAVDAAPSLLNLAPGSYRLHERAPTSSGGRWRLLRVRCNSASRSATRPFRVRIVSGQATVCTFVNRFTPRGSISIAKVTQGGSGTASFKVTSTRHPSSRYLQGATTTTPGVAAEAKPQTPGDATDHLRLGSYRILEQPPLAGGANGEWSLTSVVCNGVAVPFAQGTVDVTLTHANPHTRCVFTDGFSAHPVAPPPPSVPPPPPAPPPPAPSPDFQTGDLVVTKQASSPTVIRGRTIDFRITVHNRGPDPAQQVVLTDQRRAAAHVVAIRPSQGSCRSGRLITCRLGTLAVGHTARVTVRMRVTTTASTLRNRAVVGSGTFEPHLTNDVAAARVKVVRPARPPSPPRFTG